MVGVVGDSICQAFAGVFEDAGRRVTLLPYPGPFVETATGTRVAGSLVYSMKQAGVPWLPRRTILSDTRP